MQLAYTIIFVSDMDRSVSFYGDTIGLPLRFQSPEWTEFATDAVTLALHASDIPNPDGAKPSDSPAGRCRPGFSVANLDDFHEQMTQSSGNIFLW